MAYSYPMAESKFNELDYDEKEEYLAEFEDMYHDERVSREMEEG